MNISGSKGTPAISGMLAAGTQLSAMMQATMVTLAAAEMDDKNSADNNKS